MRPFAYERAESTAAAVGRAAADPAVAFLAGGTELVAWLKEGISAPRTVLDLSRLPLDGIHRDGEMLRIGALARLADVAANPVVSAVAPALAQAIDSAASPQIRAMGTVAGNLLQRTRCPYYRSPTEAPCNKRRPGSGCAALGGDNRTAAILGANERCVATHPSDLAVALVAVEASVLVEGTDGPRVIPIEELHAPEPEDPTRETVLRSGDLITELRVARGRLAEAGCFVKIRDRAAFDFALVSAAAAVLPDGDRIGAARVALGGVAPRPWRCRRAESELVGKTVGLEQIRRAAELDLALARPLAQNGFKVELAVRAVVRAVERSWEAACR